MIRLLSVVNWERKHTAFLWWPILQLLRGRAYKNHHKPHCPQSDRDWNPGRSEYEAWVPGKSPRRVLCFLPSFEWKFCTYLTSIVYFSYWGVICQLRAIGSVASHGWKTLKEESSNSLKEESWSVTIFRGLVNQKTSSMNFDYFLNKQQPNYFFIKTQCIFCEVLTET
jgi:hypothetical protein